MHRTSTPQPASTASLGPVDALTAAATALALAALYAWTLQERQWGDGPQIVRDFLDSLGTGGVWTHVLYFPAARALERLLVPGDPLRALELTSILGGACGGGGVYLIARAFGTDRFRALAAALLLATCPAWWFFATTTEVLGLHLACVALCALAVLLAPWQRPVLATGLACLALPLVILSHKSGVFLGPGFVALSQVGRVRRGLAPLSWPALLLGVGPAFLASFLLAAVGSARMSGLQPLEWLRSNSEFVAGYHATGAGLIFAALWGAPLGAVGLMAAAAFALRRTWGWRALAVAAWAALPVVFFGVWGVSERGGYALSTAVLLVVVAVSAFDARTRGEKAGWLALLAAQAALGFFDVRSWDAPEWGRDNRSRAAAVERAIGPRGTLFSINLRFQDIEADLPGVRELNLYPLMRRGADTQLDRELFARRVAGLVHVGCASGPVALELSSAALLVGRPEAAYLESLQRQLESEFALRPVPDARWPLVVVTRPGDG
jgi:hypothetical protein